MNDPFTRASRRRFLGVCAGVGVTSSFFAGALCSLAGQTPMMEIDDAMIERAAFLAGITISPAQKAAMRVKLNHQLRGIRAVRKVNLTNSTPPAYGLILY